MLRHALVIGALITFGHSEVARADSKQGLLVLKAMAYDRNLATRCAGSSAATVAIAYRGTVESQAETCTAVKSALEAAAEASVTVGGAAVKVVLHSYKEVGSLEKSLTEQHVCALYVCSGLDAEVAKITQLSRRHSVLSFSGSEALVREGLSIGIVQREGKPGVIINLAAVRAEGALLDSRLLNVAEVIKDSP